MTNEIRKDIEATLARLDRKIPWLARQAGLDVRTVRNMLKPNGTNLQANWLKLLNALDKELCVRDINGN